MNCIQRCLITFISFHFFFNTNTIAQPIGSAIIHDKLSITDSALTNQRMRLNTVTSMCASPKAICPGYFGNTGVFYKSYCYTNESANSECINVKMQVNCASQIFCAAYLGSFNPADVCNNYLADPGLSISNGGSDSMSFDVPAGARYCVVVSSITLGDTCSGYTLTISQFATSWHGSISNTDSTQTQRIHLDGIRNTCQNLKQLCANPPVPGTVFHDCYLYRNTTANDICIRTTLYHHCSDSLSTITSVAYLSYYDSTDVCYNIAADAGVRDSVNDSLWYTFLVPAGSNCMIVVYAQKDTLFCDDYVVKLETDFTAGINETNENTSSIQLYPNPVVQGENLTIKFNDEDYDEVDVYDITARKIFTKHFSADRKQLMIPTLSLTKGIYFVNASGEKKSIARKVVVE